MNDLVISFFDCFKADEALRFSFAGEKILPGRVFRFVPSYSFGWNFSLTGSPSEAVWRIADKCRDEVLSVCLTIGALARKAKRTTAAIFRRVADRPVQTGRGLLARVRVLRI